MTDSNQQPGLSQEEIDSVIALFSSGQLEEALDKVTKLIKTYSDNSLLHNITGACHAGLGQLGSAVKSYERAIQIDPDYAKAHNNLGNVLTDLGMLNEAKESFKNALILNPEFIEAHYSLGLVLFDLGQLNEAICSYQKALEISPDYPALHNNIGNAYKDLGQLDEALKSYKNALKLNADFADSHNNIGVILKDLGKLDEAVKSFERAIEIQRNHFEAHFNLANTYKDLSQNNKAVTCFRMSIKINPNFAEAFNNLGNTLTDIRQYDEALISFKKAVSLNPNYSEAYHNMGNFFTIIECFDDAVENYNKAIELNPNFVDAHHNLGNVLKDLGQNDNALKSFKKAIKIEPDFVEAYNNIGNFLIELERFDEALAYFKNAIDISPNFAEAYHSLGNLFAKENKVNDALDCYKKALIIDKNINYLLGSLLALKMKYCIWDNLSNEVAELEMRIINHEKVINPYSLLGLIDNSNIQLKSSEITSSDHNQKKYFLSQIPNYAKHEKIRIGYFSPDFREHPVGLLTAQLYELHDRNHFEIFAFSLWPDTKDEVNLRIKAGVDYFYNLHNISDKEIAELARSLEIDIAIDLGGFTANNRFGVFAMFAAPIQINFLGYPGTLGSDFHDYIIADKTLVSEDSKCNYSENIIYLPNCYMPQDRFRKVSNKALSRPMFNLPVDGFVFCCFNNSFKITPKEFDIWMRLLSLISGSVLWLLKVNIHCEINLKTEAKKRGVDPNRLIFADKLPADQHLARHKLADLFLDTLNFNAHTTASDALLVGLPVLTKIGNGFAARVASTLLNSLEVPELITTSENEYESLALALASNPEKLSSIKKKLSNKLTSAPLFDTKRYTKDLEKAYTLAYERHINGLPPTEIKVL